jgi:hypothetical protein
VHAVLVHASEDGPPRHGDPLGSVRSAAVAEGDEHYIGSTFESFLEEQGLKAEG